MPARIDDWSLFEERYVAVLAPTHQLANRPSIGIDELREATLLERTGCDVAPKIRGKCFAEEPPHLGHSSEHDLHLQYMAAAGFGVILAPEHMPRLPGLKTIPLEGDPIWRQVHLLAAQGRRYSHALSAFLKVARLRDWSAEINPERQAQNIASVPARETVSFFDPACANRINASEPNGVRIRRRITVEPEQHRRVMCRLE
jgi:hypothetical protein